ncbi:hypothetical protein, partial [Escherichia coli]|uniref:hypothetical protein n=1 Tax=Escherichia coli TaxID=562 RepID=UPI00227F81FA
IKLTADKSQYLRLRGTNLAPDVAGETANGEPLPDAKVDLTDNAARFNAINARNYNDLWFYSNPVFVTVKQYGATGLTDPSPLATYKGATALGS